MKDKINKILPESKKELDYCTACIIAGNKYQLINKSGTKIYDIRYPKITKFIVGIGNSFESEILYSDIGKDYWILARSFKNTPFNGSTDDKHIVNHVDELYSEHFAINLEKHWWKQIKDNDL